MDFTDRTNQLAEYFHQQISEIQKLKLPDSDDGQLLLYMKTLLVSLIDCLAGIRYIKDDYPKDERQINKWRFTKLVEEHGSWSDGNRISVPFLKSRLEKKNLKGSLFNTVSEHLSSYNPEAGNGIQITAMDLLPDDLIPHTICKPEKDAVYYVQHYLLLYRYRNNLVHESRQPGNSMSVFAQGKPCYHGYGDDENWYLVYPVELFEDIAKSAVEGIKNYFLEKQINPDDRIGDTTRW